MQALFNVILWGGLGITAMFGLWKPDPIAYGLAALVIALHELIHFIRERKK